MRLFLDVKIAKLLLFLLLISLVSGNFENAIICIEENGQAAIEFPRNGACGASGLSEYDKEHCPPCTDISISNSTEANRFNSSTKIKQSAAIVNIHYFAHDKPSLSRRNYQNLSESSFFPHNLLGSVIIRT